MDSQLFTQAPAVTPGLQQCRWDFCDVSVDTPAQLIQHVKQHAQQARGVRRSRYNQESLDTVSSGEHSNNNIVQPASRMVEDSPSSSANQFPSAQLPPPASSPYILAPNSSGSGEASLVHSTAPVIVVAAAIIATQSESLDEIHSTPSSNAEVVVVPDSLESTKSTTSGSSGVRMSNPLKDVHFSFGWGNRLPPKKSPPK